MSLRDKINSSKHVAVGVGAVLLVIATGLIFFQTRGTEETREKATTADLYYTADDGATWFADKPDRVPPFDHGGKPAVRAMVYRGTDGKPFVGYLMRYTEQAAKQVAAKPKEAVLLSTSGSEVKKPGDAKWVPKNSLAGAKIAAVTLPGGAVPDSVDP